MNTLGIAIIWCMLQVTLACVAGAVVYLVARKVGWAAGRMTAIGALAMVLVLSVAALSPWPSWFSFGGLSDRVVVMSEPGALPANDLSQTNMDPLATELPAHPNMSGPLNLAFWRSVWVEMQRTEIVAANSDATTKNAWRWPAIVATVFLATAAIGILRLLVAWLAVRQLDEKSTSIDDSHLLDLVQSISRDLSLSAPLVLKESSELQTAATFGWRQPVILLPKAWRDWPEEELRAVLAHEMAHIRSGDFLTWLLAQFIVATHFYHPLVHWLAARLRLEQELAADATAAQFAGGRETYLQSLATLTLRADHLRPSWATQTFLPTRSMFVRRIEMLKRTKTTSSERPSSKVRLAVVGTLVAIGIFAVGLRAPGPIGATPVVAAEAVGEKTEIVQETDGYDFAYIPEKFIGFFTIRPADMAKSAHLAPLAELLSENMRPGIPAEALQQVTLVMPNPQLTDRGHMLPGSGSEFTIFRTNRSIDFKKNLETSYGPMKTERHQAKEYWTWGPQLGLIAFHSPDEKTLLSRPRPSLYEVMDNPQAAQPPTQAGAWQAEADGPIFGVLNLKSFRELQGGRLPGGFIFQTFAPILNHAENVTFTVDNQKKPVLKINIACASPEQVPAVEQTVHSALVLLKNIVTSQMKALEGQTGYDIPATKELFSLASKIIENAKVTGEGRYLRLSAPLGDAATIVQAVVPQIQAARMTARRVQSVNNLKNIALAFHNYHATNGHFPPAVLYDKETGTPYSWRVEILPFIEQKALYDLYQFDQPWDSEENKLVLQTRPVQLLPPTDLTQTNTAYFALTGPETVFTVKKGTKLQEIMDGTSDTILLVETKRDIPWTKPEDIPYSPDKPLPKLGGLTKGGFNVAFCDGSVQFVAEDIAPKTLRHLIEKADGNVVDWQAIRE